MTTQASDAGVPILGQHKAADPDAAAMRQLLALLRAFLLLAPLGVALFFVADLRSDVRDAKREAGEAKATAAEAKGDAAQGALALNSVNVKLVRIETMVERLVKDSDENKAAVKALQDQRDTPDPK